MDDSPSNSKAIRKRISSGETKDVTSYNLRSRKVSKTVNESANVPAYHSSKSKF